MKETLENRMGESSQKAVEKPGEPTKKEGETKRITLENQGKINNSWEIAIRISKVKRNGPQQK
mgnify:CR=1 FL=1